MLLLATACSAAPSMSNQIVRASTGYYTGKINSDYDNVREFLNIPFGVNTAGQNRFMPPIPVPLSSQHFDATEFAEACPQYVSALPAIWNQEIPQYLQYWGAENNTAGVSAPFASEDCLKLAIWTPANATSSSDLPVALFWTGGGCVRNNYQNGGHTMLTMNIQIPDQRHIRPRPAATAMDSPISIAHRRNDQLPDEHPGLPK